MKQWEYINEGGKNIVVRYIGNKIEKYQKKVLRISKKERQEQYIYDYIEFLSKFLKPFVIIGEEIEIKKELMNEIYQDIKQDRFRKDEIDIQNHYGLLLNDLTRMNDDRDVYCIEIKPKWGMICRSKYIKNEIKYEKCRYCMHQELKLFKKEIEKKSEYCPLDLFSNNEKRMKYALLKLLEIPQNNLKIFKNQKLIKEMDQELFINLIYLSLKDSQVLQKIKRLQLLDQYDIEYIYSLYQKDMKLSFQKSDFIQKEDFIYKIQSKIYPDIEYKCEKDKDIILNLERDNKYSDEEIIMEYLISHTLKDCSIMISFQQDENGNIEYEKNNYSYKIGIVDLDPKSIDSIPKYYELDQEIINFYKGS